jgi:aldehyde dehydrogenase (NAD+)
VAAPYFNFTVSEPVGVCGVIAPDSAPLLGLITLVIPILVSGNTVLALASESSPYPAILLGEMLATSDLPAGVLNLLTGFRKEILPTMATHEHIRAVHAACDSEEQKALHLGAAESVKRVHCLSSKASTDWKDSSHQSLQMLANFVEYKTVWHPIGT